MPVFVVALILALGSVSTAAAQATGLPPTFRCDFTSGDGHSLSSGSTDARKAALVHDVMFTDISTSTGTALQILPTGETPLTVASSGADTVHLMEAEANGSVTLTTIFLRTKQDVDGGGFTYPVYRAVMSRHGAAYRGVAEASQVYGSCKGVR